MPATLPPWIVASDPAAQAARGLSLGMQMGAEQAQQQFREQQAQRQQQLDAQQQAMEQARLGLSQAEFEMQAQAAARKYQAMQDYRKRVAAGEDPMQVLMEVGPQAGIAGSAQAAAIRSMNMQPKQAPQLSQMTMPDGTTVPYFVSGGRVQFPPAGLLKRPDAFQAGPVQGQPVLDPVTKQPMPGFVATPSPSGRGMTVHLRNGGPQLSRHEVFTELAKLPELETSYPGITKQLGPQLQAKLSEIARGAEPAPQWEGFAPHPDLASAAASPKLSFVRDSNGKLVLAGKQAQASAEPTSAESEPPATVPAPKISPSQFIAALKADPTKLTQDAISKLGNEIATAIGPSPKADLLQIGSSVFHHNPGTIYADALLHGKSSLLPGLTGDKVWAYIMKLPEDERSQMFADALDAADIELPAPEQPSPTAQSPKQQQNAEDAGYE